MKLALYYLTKLLEMNQEILQKALPIAKIFNSNISIPMQRRMSQRFALVIMPALCILNRYDNSRDNFFRQINLRHLFLTYILKCHLKILSRKYSNITYISQTLKSLLDNQLVSLSICYGIFHASESLKHYSLMWNKLLAVLETCYMLGVLGYCVKDLVDQRSISESQSDTISEEDRFGNNDFTGASPCPLCLKNQKVAASCIPCGHSFCWKCIHSALKVKPQCPICRFPASSSRVVQLKNSL